MSAKTLNAKTRIAKTRMAALSACCGPASHGDLSDTDAQTLAAGFAALADPVRLRLLSLIAAADADGVCACNLVEPVGRSQPTVSHHLKILREAGLVSGERHGTWVYYRALTDQIAALREALL